MSLPACHPGAEDIALVIEVADTQAQRVYRDHPFTPTLSAESLQQWWTWAEWIVRMVASL